jgi:phosphoribosylformylglycinamidine synthase
VGTLPMGFIHDGIPTPTREAAWKPARPIRPRLSQTIKWTWQSGARARSGGLPAIGEALLALLAHPSIASKHWIIRQYDHEVQGNTVIKPLVGPGGRGPGNASVIEPIPGSGKGVAVACGLQTGIGDPAVGGDPYLMALAAIDECVRNLVCTGADPARIAILDNFCWPSCDKPANLASLVRAAEGCYDGAKAYRTPFVSGKDSLNNQLRYQDPETGEQKVIEIPPTLLITGLGLVQSLSRCMTMDAKSAGNTLLLIGTTTSAMAGSHYQQLFGIPPEDDSSPGSEAVPATDLAAGPATAKAVAELIRQGLIASAHDCSDGGFLAAVSEMLIASGGAGPSLGADVTLAPSVLSLTEQAFAETPSRYVVEVRPADMQRVRTVLTDHGAIFAIAAAKLNPTGRLTWAQADLDAGVEELATAWRAPLDW